MRKKAFKSFVPLGDQGHDEESPLTTRYQASRIQEMKPKGVLKAQLKAQLKRKAALSEMEKSQQTSEPNLIDRHVSCRAYPRKGGTNGRLSYLRCLRALAVSTRLVFRRTMTEAEWEAAWKAKETPEERDLRLGVDVHAVDLAMDPDLEPELVEKANAEGEPVWPRLVGDRAVAKPGGAVETLERELSMALRARRVLPTRLLKRWLTGYKGAKAEWMTDEWYDGMAEFGRGPR